MSKCIEKKIKFNQFARPSLIILSAGLWAGSSGAAEDDSSRPIRMIIPMAVGGSTDIVGRVIAQQLTGTLGKIVVVDNRAGASGIIGTEAVAKSTPDGNTLLFASNSVFAVNPAVFKKLPYDIFRDLKLVSPVAHGAHVLAVRGNLPVKTVGELVALAKKQPGKLTFASSGTGAILHMSGELLKDQTKIDIVEVPFKGGGPAIIAMLSSEVDMMMNDLSSFVVHFKSGKLKAMAVADPKRLPSLPEIPTFTEEGFPGVEAGSWFGLAVPASTPDAILRQINGALEKILAMPAFKQTLSQFGMEPLLMTPEETTAYTKREIEKWSRLAKAAKIEM